MPIGCDFTSPDCRLGVRDSVYDLLRLAQSSTRVRVGLPAVVLRVGYIEGKSSKLATGTGIFGQQSRKIRRDSFPDRRPTTMVAS